jgi:hypothetical protein
MPQEPMVAAAYDRIAVLGLLINQPVKEIAHHSRMVCPASGRKRNLAIAVKEPLPAVIRALFLQTNHLGSKPVDHHALTPAIIEEVQNRAVFFKG